MIVCILVLRDQPGFYSICLSPALNPNSPSVKQIFSNVLLSEFLAKLLKPHFLDFPNLFKQNLVNFFMHVSLFFGCSNGYDSVIVEALEPCLHYNRLCSLLLLYFRYRWKINCYFYFTYHLQTNPSNVIAIVNK